MSTIGLDQLRDLLRTAGGDPGGLDGDILDVSFEEIGYDSIAMLETAVRLRQEYGVDLDDEVLTEAETPRALLALVNEARGNAA